MIRLDGLTLSRGGRDLLLNASAAIVPGSRVALIGRNGCGKSTLFAAILGDVALDGGRIDLNGQSIAWVDQTAPDSDGSVHAFAMQSKPEVATAWHDSQQDSNAESMARAHQWLSEHDAYRFPSQVAQLLHGLGFDAAAQARPVNSFSGGWKMRLALARALLMDAPILLLDEPTNHLDLDAIIWLENYLLSYTGTVFLISHDREFVDAAATAVLSFSLQQLRLYSGGYTSFEQARALEQSQLQQAQRKHDLQTSHLRSFIDRFRAQATKARQVQSRIKALERLGSIVANREPDAPQIEFLAVGEGPDPLLKVEGLRAGYDPSTPLLSNVSMVIKRQDRIGILGRNGAGKSTLLKTLVGELPLIAGSAVSAPDLRVGYFAQDAVDSLREDESALTQIGRKFPQKTQQEVRNFLAGFGITGEMALSPVGPMSGGERARVALAGVALARPQLLILDEPTNHLDAATRDALTTALAQFDGAVLLVSHDRQLLHSCVDSFILVASGAVTAFDGDLEDYAKWLNSKQSSESTVLASKTAPVAKPEPARQGPSKQQMRQWEKRIHIIETELRVLNEDQSRIEAQMQSGELFKDPNQASITQKQYASQSDAIMALEMEWLELQESIESASGK